MPSGFVDNSDDTDDYCYSNVHDCFGECDGDGWVSDCGCVAGDNSGDDCDDCAGEPHGSAVVDECGICGGSGIPEDECDCNESIEDCAGVCGGDALIDECGDWGGTAELDNCQNCIGGLTGKTGCIQDCNKDWDGNALLDKC